MLIKNCLYLFLITLFSLFLTACANFHSKSNQPAICKEIKHRQMFGDKGRNAAGTWKARAEESRLAQDYKTAGCG